jgi:ribosomal-protein-alanine N-acetyltransferase
MVEENGAIKLTGGRISLRTPEPFMAQGLLEFLGANRERFAPMGPKLTKPLSLEFTQKWIEASSRDREQGHAVRFVVFEQAGGDRIIGDLSFTNIVRGVFLACHLGFRIDTAYEGKGYMREALSLALQYAFEELSLHRVMANYMPTNARSGALLRRLGFSVEGYARDYLYLNGTWQDHILTSLIAPPRQ